MSMNLIFVHKDYNAMDEFPYQTSTDLTKDVLNASTMEEKIKLIEKDLEDRGWDKEWSETALTLIKLKLTTGWELSMI